ncbi:MAG TPA: hypothetical protein VG847_13095 [Chitinophagaceae bacterium]|nr:hypothetical protein [Chitinophagaceae bacterium]
MKKIFAFIAVSLLAACNSNESSKDDGMSPSKDSTMSTMSAMPVPIQSPDYKIGYSSSFVMDDPKNAESVLKLWKIWDDGDLSKSKDIFGDNDTLYLADGTVLTGPKDSIIASSQKFRSSLVSSVSRVDAIMAVKSTDRNEHWALIWGMEKDSSKGKVDSFFLQETWRFNNDGKADMLYQFRHAAAPPKTMK